MSLEDPEQRYELFIEQALASEELYGLESGGRLIRLQLPDGRLALPLWPTQESAALEAPDASEQPKKIGIEELLESLLPEMASQNAAIAVFPLKGASYVTEALPLLDRLTREWDEDD